MFERYGAVLMAPAPVEQAGGRMAGENYRLESALEDVGDRSGVGEMFRAALGLNDFDE